MSGLGTEIVAVFMLVCVTGNVETNKPVDVYEHEHETVEGCVTEGGIRSITAEIENEGKPLVTECYCVATPKEKKLEIMVNYTR